MHTPDPDSLGNENLYGAGERRGRWKYTPQTLWGSPYLPVIKMSTSDRVKEEVHRAPRFNILPTALIQALQGRRNERGPRRAALQARTGRCTAQPSGAW